MSASFVFLIIQIFCQWQNSDGIDGWIDEFISSMVGGHSVDTLQLDNHYYCDAILNNLCCPSELSLLFSAAQFAMNCRCRCGSLNGDCRHLGPDEIPRVNPQQIIADLHQTLKASRTILYLQGISILRHLSSSCNIEVAEALKYWKAVSVLNRAVLELVETTVTVEFAGFGCCNLLLQPSVSGLISPSVNSLRRINTLSIACGLAVPVIAASMTLCDIHARNRDSPSDVDISWILGGLYHN